jgi:hypothetical protein
MTCCANAGRRAHPLDTVKAVLESRIIDNKEQYFHSRLGLRQRAGQALPAVLGNSKNRMGKPHDFPWHAACVFSRSKKLLPFSHSPPSPNSILHIHPQVGYRVDTHRSTPFYESPDTGIAGNALSSSVSSYKPTTDRVSQPSTSPTRSSLRHRARAPHTISPSLALYSDTLSTLPLSRRPLSSYLSARRKAGPTSVVISHTFRDK